MNRVTHLLDSNGISYRLLPHEKPVYTCEEAARERNVPLGEMIKCILLVDKKKNYYLACLTSDKMLDTQKVRMLLNCSRLSFASDREIWEVLGYRKGSIPPLLLKTEIPIVFDNGITKKETLNISSGEPNAGIEVSRKDLVPLVKPRFGDICKQKQL